ncbi:hypothetical protein KVR01_007109 [Diaporthe batatas]|uniref:uncharacterized protein n=1 Tax=Diaporthe batatas TaxID=748121 RepID=UPI001D0493E9|nr:uncharacterized protein KVR01_007109 [Diaporthe batatas]KAG8162631.1 hypothetical protein KVR01_007109 [Diaporthe batatas]
MSRPCHPTTTAAAALLLALCGLVIQGAMAGDKDPIRFLYPAEEGLEFHYLDRVDVSYLSNFTEPYLYIWCGQGNAKQKQVDRPNGGNATTEITLQFEADQDLEDDCWFNIRIHDLSSSVQQGNNSKAFTYLHTAREGGPATMGLPSATTTSVPAPTASSVTNPTDDSAPSPSSATTTDPAAAASSSSSSSSGGLSAGATAGIAAGVSVGAIAIAAAVGAFFFLRRRRRKNGGAWAAEKHGGAGMGRTDTRDVGGRGADYPASELQGHGHASEMAGGMAAYKGKYAPVAPGSPQEMPADHAAPEFERHELPAGLDGGRDEGKFRP